MLDPARLSGVLTQRYGVHMTGDARQEEGGLRAEFRPADLPYTRGFSVGILIGWRTVCVSFTPATFGKQVLYAMAKAGPDKRRVFHTFVEAAINSGAAVTLRVNDQNLGTSLTDVWPSDWRSLNFEFSKGPMTIDSLNLDEVHQLALEWSSRMLGSVLALMPLEAVEQPPSGNAEGGGYQTQITRYERSTLNRQACMDFHGHSCMVCGFDFKKVYGFIGEGFIEVHHIESLASLAPGTVLDPRVDLIPLCSNCHSMAHKRQPEPYTVIELQAMIAMAADPEKT